MRRIVPLLLVLVTLGFAAKSMVFDAIGTQQAGQEFTIRVRAMDGGSPISTYNYDANLSVLPSGEISPSLVSFVNGVWQGKVKIMRRDKQQSQIRCIGTDPDHITGVSNEFNVMAGPAVRITVRSTIAAITAGAPSRVLIAAWADSSGNPVDSVSPFLTWKTTAAHATMPSGTIRGVDTLTITILSGPDPYAADEFAKHNIWPEATDPRVKRVDTLRNFRVNPGDFDHILVIAPGETPDPGSSVGVTGGARVIAYRDTVFDAFAVDRYNNQVFSNPAHDVSLWSNAGSGFYDVDTQRLRPEATPLTVQFAPTPTASPVVYQFKSIDVTDPARSGALRNITVVPMPNLIELSTQLDTIQPGLSTALTATVSVVVDSKKLGFPGDTVVFALVGGDTQAISLPTREVITDLDGNASATAVGVVEGSVLVEARSKIGGITTTRTIFVSSAEPITAFPNPFHRSTQSTKVLFVLNSDARSATLIISDLFGNIVLRKDYKEGEALKGANSFAWDGKNSKDEWVASGVYVVRVQANLEHESFSQRRRIVVLP